MVTASSQMWVFQVMTEKKKKKNFNPFYLYLEWDMLLRYIVSQASSESVILTRTSSVILLTDRGSAITVSQSHWSLLTKFVTRWSHCLTFGSGNGRKVEMSVCKPLKTVCVHKSALLHIYIDKFRGKMWEQKSHKVFMQTQCISVESGNSLLIQIINGETSGCIASSGPLNTLQTYC